MPSLEKWRSHASRSKLSKTQRWLRRIRAVVIVLIALAVVGAAYEPYAAWRDARRFPAPGQFIQTANGRRHVVCDGTGSPVVLFEPSGFSNSTSFAAARGALAKVTRVCTYDRAGVGWSDRAPSTLSAGMLADDLASIQAAIAPQPPIIVASSIGGLTTELFARRHPDRVAALVFLDAANSEMFDYVREHAWMRTMRAGCSTLRVAGRVGLIRAMDLWKLRANPDSARAAALMYDAKPWEMLCALVPGSDATAKEFTAAPPLPATMPVVALSAGSDEELLPPKLRWLGIDVTTTVAMLHETHKHLAARSLHGTWKVVPGSTHLIASSNPDVVVQTVSDLLRASRAP